MIASLMMYERTQLAHIHRRLWELIRVELNNLGIESPETLSQNADEFSVWLNPELVLSQTCGMPYRTWLHGKVKLVGTPDYGVPGCEPGYYCSPIVVRKNDTRDTLLEFKDATFCFNQPFSQSGYAAPYWHAADFNFWFAQKFQSGSHLKSAIAVAKGQADIASLDAVTWRLIEQYEDVANQLRVLDWTTPTPGLPLITSLGQNQELILSAVDSALLKLEAQEKAALGIRCIVQIPSDEYMAIPNPDLEECRRFPG